MIDVLSGNPVNGDAVNGGGDNAATAPVGPR